MNYIVVTQEWLAARNILPLPTMRKSKDGTKYLAHEDFFNAFKTKNAEDEEVLEGLTLYPHNSNELNELLNSEEWAWDEAETPAESQDYIQVEAVKNLMAVTKAGIQTMVLTDNEALKVKDMYPTFDEVIGEQLESGFKLQDGGKLYKVIQAHTAQADWKPAETPALYGLVTESHAGTLEDPIPYVRMMVLEAGKYYTQFGVVYKCVTGSIVGYDADLTDLMSLLEVVSQEGGAE